jgi:hypothetical protein
MEIVVTPNIFAFIALLFCLPVMVLFFSYLRPPLALMASTLWAILFLPERVELFDLPALPPFNKAVVMSLSLLVAAVASSASRDLLRRAGWAFPLGVVALLTFSAWSTTFANGDSLRYGPTLLPAMGVADGISLTVRDTILIATPFLLGRALCRSESALKDVLSSLVVGALLYSPFILLELRLSPQFHNWTYGFGQHAFSQTIRGSGYRPMVYMNHGLALAAFLASALLAAGALARTRLKLWKVPCALWTGFLALILVLCKSMGALLYGIGSLPLVLFLKSRLLLTLAAGLALTTLLFPWLRIAGVFPTEEIVAQAAAVDEDRGASLGFRFDNEEAMLEKARERPIFGWGIYGRSRVIDDYGVDQSVTDGFWIIQLGERGLVGFMIAFTLLLYPVFSAFRSRRRLEKKTTAHLLSALALIVTLRVVELLPNGVFSCLPYLLSGVLAGIITSRSTPSAPSQRPAQPKKRRRPPTKPSRPVPNWPR